MKISDSAPSKAAPGLTATDATPDLPASEKVEEQGKRFASLLNKQTDQKRQAPGKEAAVQAGTKQPAGAGQPEVGKGQGDSSLSQAEESAAAGRQEAAEGKPEATQSKDAEKGEDGSLKQEGLSQTEPLPSAEAALAAGQTASGPQEVKPAEVTAAARADINQIAQDIAERVLVSRPGEAGRPEEVRIQLKDSVLQGSEVRVYREGGELQVEFITKTPEATSFVAGHLGDMERTLADRLPGEVVRVSQQDPSAEKGEDEGRSRQQYVSEDEQEGGR